MINANANDFGLSLVPCRAAILITRLCAQHSGLLAQKLAMGREQLAEVGAGASPKPVGNNGGVGTGGGGQQGVCGLM